MEGKFQSRSADDDGTGNTEQTNKRSPMTLNVTGLWDVVPRLDHYRLSRRAKRPSLGDLHEGNPVKDTNLETGQPGGGAKVYVGIKLGWIQGVLIPCLLNIWGVMLFLRLSWVVAHAGILQSLIIIGISAIVCVITTLSLSAISTNGEVKGGGIYYIISRSLGPEFGASVGIVFAFANAVAASMNTIGFCDSLNQLLTDNGLKIIDNGINDVRIVGIVAVLVMIMICAIGMEWESKAQNFLIAVIVGAIVDFIVGTIIGPNSDKQIAEGFTGFSSEVFVQNWKPDYRYSEGKNQSFFSVFAIFFPSVTGIQAGANISGDLRDPAKSIPIGTLLALLISMISYATFVLFAGGAAVRDAGGFVNETIVNCTMIGSNCTKFGLHHSYSVMQLMSAWGPFIYAGCFAATLSTALTNLLSVPRLIQALGIDRIYPGLIFFSKGYGKAGEPYRGYVLTFLVASLFVLIANLNAIAPLISNFYLASYALINFCTFHAALVRPLGWRPTFKYYNTWLSLIGFVLCVAIMFLIDWVMSLVTFVIIFALYLIVVYRKPDVNWGSSTQAQTYKTALSIVYRLNSTDEHVKNYAPQILALTGQPSARPALLHLANLITKNNSLLMCGEVNPSRLSYQMRSTHLRAGYTWLNRHRIKAFYHVVEGLGLETGASALMQAAGVGKLAPNVVLMGYKTHWASCEGKELQEYFNVLHNAFDNRMAVAILRITEGLDCSVSGNGLGEEEHGILAQSSYDLAGNALMHADSNLSISSGLPRVHSVPSIGTQYLPNDNTSIKSVTNNGSARDHLKNKKRIITDKLLIGNGMTTVPEYMTIFQKKHKNGVLDVWWLYDDGGLTILLPYIISTRSNWENCKMRIFALANHKQEIADEEKEMAEIMAKFRIKYTSLKMVDDISVQPHADTQKFFDTLISGFREKDGVNNTEYTVTEAELQTLRDKTNRQLRLRELLLENSSDSTFVVMSLPMPRKGAVSAALYMAWLEALTRDMPPTLLVRGNHTSVLTFYS